MEYTADNNIDSNSSSTYIQSPAEPTQNNALQAHSITCDNKKGKQHGPQTELPPILT